MAYTLQALISDHSLIEKAAKESLHSVILSSEVAMIPLAESVIEPKGIPFLPLTDEGEERIVGVLHDLCMKLSHDTRLAYIEADFWGGDGTQAAWLIEDGKEIRKTFVSASAINEALRWIGVSKDSAHDEFEAIALDRHRETSDWIKHEAYQGASDNADKPRV